MNESPIVLACEDVTLGYEHKPLLEHLTLTVRAGDYLCICLLYTSPSPRDTR